MNHYVALFRGINVGGKQILPMQDLKDIMENLNYQNVATYIQSGNVVFSSKNTRPKTAAQNLSSAIAAQKGFTPLVMILSAAEFHKAMTQNPFPVDDGKTLHCYFLAESPPQPNLEKLEALQADDEQYQLIDQCFYLHAPNGIGRSKLAAGAEKALGVAATARNWNTVAKLATLLRER